MNDRQSKPSPYRGEGLVGNDSYLRRLPIALTAGERMRYDALVTAADIIAQAFGLLRQFTAQAGAEMENFTNEYRAWALGQCWTIIDQLHAARQLLRKKKGPLTRAFLNAAEVATKLRNRMDHLSDNLDNIAQAKGLRFPLFGSLSYFYAPDPESARRGGRIITITSGALHGQDMMPLINPAGEQFTLPTGLFTFSAFGHQIEFGHGIGALRDLIREMDSRMENDIRTQVEARAQSPEEVDQAMATLGGGLTMIAVVEFVEGDSQHAVGNVPSD